LTIICEVTPFRHSGSGLNPEPKGPYALGAGEEWDLFRPCCPLNFSQVHGRTNNYFTEYDCIAKYCATNNVTLAENWGECVESAWATRLDEIKRNDTRINSTAFTASNRCEWIDYDLVERMRDLESGAALHWAVGAFSILGPLALVSSMQFLG